MNRFEMINSIIDDATLTSTQKMIMVVLWRFSDERGISYPSVSKIMSCSGIGNQKTYYNNRDKLIELGWLKVEQIKGKGCIYKIEVPTQSQILQNDTTPTSNMTGTDTSKIAEQTNHLTKQSKENNILTSVQGAESDLLKYIHSEDNQYYDYINGGWMSCEMSSEFIC